MGPYAVGFISICLVVHPQEIVKGFSFWQKNIRPAVPDMCPPTVTGIVFVEVKNGEGTTFGGFT